MRSPDLRIASRRLAVMRVLLLVGFVLVAIRAGQLAVIDTRGARRGVQQTQTAIRLAAERGTIFDRNLAELTLSIEHPSVFALPRQIGSVDATATALAPILDTKSSSLRKRLAVDQPFVFLSRWVSEEAALRIDALDLKGIGIVREAGRSYPYDELAAQVLGFANIDGVGVRGIEQQEDDWLQGSARRYPVERDARGRLLAVSNIDALSTAGGDIALTIDAALQADAEAALDHAIALSEAEGGIVLTLDPHTGEVLSLAERPTFNPNRFRNVEYVETRARALLDAYEPGSILKVFLVAGALEREAVEPSDVFDCESGTFQVPGKVIRDVSAHGLIDVASIIRVSSNVGAVKIGHALGAEPLYDNLRRFGFGRSTGSGFPDESSGLIRSWKNWRPVDFATISFGQGISVTAMQIASAAAVLANGGILVKPRLISARRVPGGPWRYGVPEKVRRVISPETAREVRRMMELATGPDGTGRRAQLRGVSVAGKTGTAQKFDLETGSYSMDDYIAWFVGLVPAEDPELAVVVALDTPRQNLHTGGVVAAPLFAATAAAHLTHRGIATTPVYDMENVAAARPKPVVPEVKRERFLLPDFQGLTLPQVQKLSEQRSLILEVIGDGRAVDQEPVAGTIVAGQQQRVRVRFEPSEG